MEGQTGVIEKPADAASEPKEKAPEQPKLTPEQEAFQNAQKAQIALAKLQQEKTDKCAKEVNEVLAKYGCEFKIGHVVNIVPKQG